jgi:uncharacterized OsmC-like protein
MKISAVVRNSASSHEVTLSTAGSPKTLEVPVKTGGAGSAVNGGEFLMLALATCYCNDLYREAQRLGIVIDGVRVEATGEFEGIGLAATQIRYAAQVASKASADSIAALLRETDAVAEVHNTLRQGAEVTLVQLSDAAGDSTLGLL